MGNVALGIAIKTMRMSRRLSQNELAERIGVSRSAVSMWENGEREPNFDMIEALADVFNVPMSAFLDKMERQTSQEFLYISKPSGDADIDELRKSLHEFIDSLGNEELKAMSIMIKLSR